MELTRCAKKLTSNVRYFSILTKIRTLVEHSTSNYMELSLLHTDRQRMDTFFQLIVVTTLKRNIRKILIFIGMLNKNNNILEFTVSQKTAKKL